MLKEHLKEWVKVMDLQELSRVLATLDHSCNPSLLCPEKPKVFKAFLLCPYESVRVVILGQDPYSQKGVATGLCFANNSYPLSPSLENLREVIQDPYHPNYDSNPFDPTLESWASQGVLLLNAALTTLQGISGAHQNLWRPFIGSLIKNLSLQNPGLIFLLLGAKAKTFTPYIHPHCYTLSYDHPARAARLVETYACDGFEKVNQILFQNNATRIKW